MERGCRSEGPDQTDDGKICRRHSAPRPPDHAANWGTVKCGNGGANGPTLRCRRAASPGAVIGVPACTAQRLYQIITGP